MAAPKDTGGLVRLGLGLCETSGLPQEAGILTHGQRLQSPEQAPQALSLLLVWLPEGISQVMDSPQPRHTTLQPPGATDQCPDQEEATPYLWVFAFPRRSIWWSPTLPVHGHIHLCICAKLLRKDVHHGSVCNSENQMQTPCLSLGAG